MKLIAFLLTLLVSASLYADQLIIEPDMGRKPILDAFQKAQHSIDIVMYGYTDPELLNALTEQSQRSIKVLLEAHPYKVPTENNTTIELLKSNHIPWQGELPPLRLIHQKTVIIDDRTALVLTFNFTQSTFKHERNFGLLIDTPQTVHDIETIFQADWNHQPSTSNNPNLIYSPDDSRAKLIQLITQAKHSLKIYAQTVSDYELVGALAKAAKNGIDVQILTSSSLQTKSMEYLKNAGVTLHESPDLYIHAKVMIFDDQAAVIGSINLTNASLDDNRELSVITHDPEIVKALIKVFELDCHVGLSPSSQ